MQNSFRAQTISDRSLLRYPGGKSRAVQIIFSYFPKDVKEIISPFFGGGSVELFAASNGIKVHGFDVFEPLVEFWQCLLHNPDELADEVQKWYPLSKEKFYHLQKAQTGFETKLQRAAVYYVLNRCSFSGSTLSGGMSPHHPRFTQSSIKRIRDFFNPNVTIKKLDFKESLQLHKDAFAYLDPPYLIKNSLYGKNGNVHKNFDHIALAQILKERKNWLLSYNDCEEIRTLYNGYQIIAPQWKYGMSSNKSSKEVLIFSKD